MENKQLVGLAPQQVAAALREGALLLDVREEAEFSAGHVAGAVLMPMKLVDVEVVRQMAKGKPVMVMCKSGGRSEKVGVFLQDAGIDVRQGFGVVQWVAAGLPFEGEIL